MTRYLGASDVNRRLTGGVVRYKDQFWYVRGVIHSTDDDTRMTIVRPNMNSRTVDANSPEVDIASPPMGYYQVGIMDDAVFILRPPYRRQNQAAGASNLVGIGVINEDRRNISSDTVCSLPFLNMLDGVYDLDWKKYLEHMRDGYAYAIALSQDFALKFYKKGTKVSHTLHYRGEIAGHLLPDLQTVKLKEEYDHSIIHMKLLEVRLAPST